MKRREFMPHQQIGYDLLREHHGQYGVFMAPGTGKTLVVIRYAHDHRFLPALIICRRDDFLTWYDELTSEGVKPSQITMFDKTRKLTRFIEKKEKVTPWTMVTYDLVKNKRVFGWLTQHAWSLVVADESHMIKRWQSQRTKCVVKATRHIPRRIPMSGSPITNDHGDVFSQILFCDGGKTFGDNFWRFRNRYYVHSPHSGGWYPRSGSKVLIAKKLKDISYYVDEDDAMKLPPKRSLIKSVPMTSKQKKYYRQVLEDWEVQLRDMKEPLEINQVIVQLNKLKQIASGFIYLPHPTDKKKRKVMWFSSGKLDLLKELLTRKEYLANKPKIVIWCSFTTEIKRVLKLAKELRIKAVGFYGSNQKQKNQARRSFRDDPKVRLFVGQVDSGVGMNELIVADTAIYFSNSHKVVSRQQSMRRIRRRGSEIHNQITYWDLIAEDSVDLPILKAIQKSMSLAVTILNHLRKGEALKKVLSRSNFD